MLVNMLQPDVLSGHWISVNVSLPLRARVLCNVHGHCNVVLCAKARVVHPMPQLIRAVFGNSLRGNEVGGKPSWV